MLTRIAWVCVPTMVIWVFSGPLQAWQDSTHAFFVLDLELREPNNNYV